MVRLVVTDIDDTLVARERRVITPKGLSAIHDLLGCGIVFGPATGRDTYRIGYSFRFDRRCYLTAVVANGMKVYHEGEKILEKVLPQEGIQKVAEACAEEPRACLLIFGDQGRIWAAGTTIDEMIVHHLKHLQNSAGVSRQVPESIRAVKANCHFDGSLEDQAAFQRALEETAPELDFTCPAAGIVDITTHGWDKGEATLWLARQLGIGRDEICAFGDAGNDEQLIRKIPNSVAVANAFEEIVEAARWHIGTTSDDAVAEALEDIVRATRSGGVPQFMTDAANRQGLALAARTDKTVPKGVDS